MYTTGTCELFLFLNCRSNLRVFSQLSIKFAVRIVWYTTEEEEEARERETRAPVFLPPTISKRLLRRLFTSLEIERAYGNKNRGSSRPPVELSKEKNTSLNKLEENEIINGCRSLSPLWMLKYSGRVWDRR